MRSPPDLPARRLADKGTRGKASSVIDPFLADVRALDWNDLDAVEATNRKVLTILAERPDVLHALLHQVTQRPELLALCEHYDILDKLVLYDDQQYGFRVRLHVFLPGYFDRPHNHRWTYSSRILHGSYRHYLYGPDDGLTDTSDVDQLVPLMVREEVAGSTYTLHHRMVHAVVAEPYTVSLTVRGPAVKQRFLVMDRATKGSWWQYGAKDEPTEEAERKRMTIDRLHATRAKLEELAVL